MASSDIPPASTVDLQFHYIKAPDYQEVTCDGVVGSVTPAGQKICMSVYTERAPIPRMISFTVETADGNIVQFDERSAQPSHVESRQGVVRNVHTSVYLEVDTAKRLIEWLTARVGELEARK